MTAKSELAAAAKALEDACYLFKIEDSATTDDIRRRLANQAAELRKQSAALSPPAGDWKWMPVDKIVNVDRSFAYSEGMHTPFVTVTFPNSDWDARDAFAAALQAAAPPADQPKEINDAK